MEDGSAGWSTPEREGNDLELFYPGRLAGQINSIRRKPSYTKDLSYAEDLKLQDCQIMEDKARLGRNRTTDRTGIRC